MGLLSGFPRCPGAHRVQLLEEHLKAVPKLKMTDVWTTSDQRPDRSYERWLNCLIAKA